MCHNTRTMIIDFRIPNFASDCCHWNSLSNKRLIIYFSIFVVVFILLKELQNSIQHQWICTTLIVIDCDIQWKWSMSCSVALSTILVSILILKPFKSEGFNVIQMNKIEQALNLHFNLNCSWRFSSIWTDLWNETKQTS